MVIENTRNQHPVGHGFFHSGSLAQGGRRRLSYIYDCGSMQRYKTAREREIRKYLKQAGARSSLDILFISHVHADHLNGLEQLLDATNGVQPDTIVLPFVNVVDRLIAFGRTAAEDPSAAQSAFYRDFVIDPVAALGRFNPRQILFVKPGRREDGAPDGEDRPFDRPDGPEILGSTREERGVAWKLVGRGSVQRQERPPLSVSGEQSEVAPFVVPDTLAIMIPDAHAAWLLAPFVDPNVTADRKIFLAELAKQCGVPRSKIASWLELTENVRSLVTVDLDLLAAAFGAVTGNLNVTSLCLYSGPSRIFDPRIPRGIIGMFGCVQNQDSGPNARIAWLATGDAALKQKQRRAEFVMHYGKLLDGVATLTLPHHGSDQNFDIDLLSKVNPRVCVAAADRYSTWKHPGPHTVQAVCSQPAVLQVVTSNKRSSAFELAILG